MNNPYFSIKLEKLSDPSYVLYMLDKKKFGQIKLNKFTLVFYRY